jgi:hypothetical protein
MPRGDGTGPMGMGPMTGRGAGFCAGATAPGFTSAGFGFGRGRGRGRGFGRMYNPGWQAGYVPYGYRPPVAPAAPAAGPYGVDEKEALQRQAQFLEEQLNEIKDRLSKLESE